MPGKAAKRAAAAAAAAPAAKAAKAGGGAAAATGIGTGPPPALPLCPALLVDCKSALRQLRKEAEGVHDRDRPGADAAALFWAPVAPGRDGVPDYFDKVARPVDLGTVERRIDALQYPGVDGVARDVQQVWSNVDAYWGARPADPVGRWVRGARDQLRRKWDAALAAALRRHAAALAPGAARQACGCGGGAAPPPAAAPLPRLAGRYRLDGRCQEEGQAQSACLADDYELSFVPWGGAQRGWGGGALLGCGVAEAGGGEAPVPFSFRGEWGDDGRGRWEEREPRGAGAAGRVRVFRWELELRRAADGGAAAFRAAFRGGGRPPGLAWGELRLVAPLTDGVRAVRGFLSHNMFTMKVHREMVGDRRRTDLYRDAVRDRCAAKVVVDVGTGPTAVLALAAGAAARAPRRVFAVEQDARDAARARARVAAAAPAVAVEVIEGSTVDLTLPEPAQLIVHEVFGTFLSQELVVETLRDLAARGVVARGCESIPERARMQCVPLALPPAERARAWTGGDWHDPAALPREAWRLAAEQAVEDVRFGGAQLVSGGGARDVLFAARRGGRWSALGFWLEVDVDASRRLRAGEEGSHWTALWLRLPGGGAQVSAGALLRVRFTPRLGATAKEYRFACAVARRDAAPAAEERRCPAGHALAASVAGGRRGVACAHCGGRAAASFRCVPCDYDICAACAGVQWAELPPVTTCFI